MMASVSVKLRSQHILPEPIGHRSSSRWWQNVRHSFVKWLIEPIPFPGKCPVSDSRRERYNIDESKFGTSDEIEVNDR